jgi:hypothetical protein
MKARIPARAVKLNRRITGSSSQSLRWPSSRMYCSEPSPSASSPSPIPSIGSRAGSVGFRIIVRMTIAAKIPGATLMKKT